MRDWTSNNFFFCLLLTAYGSQLTAVQGQVEVSASLERNQFLLYEPIDISVRVTSQISDPLFSKRAAQSEPWLDFFITTQGNDEIGHTGKVWSPPPISLLAGESKTVTVNLTPAFQIREAGEYRVEAQIALGGGKATSHTINFSVINGSAIWQKEFTAPPAPEDKTRLPRHRLYSLLVQRRESQTVLYVRIMNPDAGTIYCTAPMGSIVNYGDPRTHIGPDGDLHVLYQTGTRLYHYSRFSPSGKNIVSRQFSNISSTPMMITGEDNETDIIGGEELTVDKERETHEIPTAPVAHALPEGAGQKMEDGERKIGSGERRTEDRRQRKEEGGMEPVEGEKKKEGGGQKRQIILTPEF